MITVESAGIVALLILCFIMTLILIWVLVYVHRQAGKVSEIQKRLDLLDHPAEPTELDKETTDNG